MSIAVTSATPPVVMSAVAMKMGGSISSWSRQRKQIGQLHRYADRMPRFGRARILTEREVEKPIAAAKGNRWGQRDSTISPGSIE
jgi:hypothetical protein